MKKRLIVGVLALGLFAFGCDDEGDAGGTDARSDGGDAGDAGRLDGARDGGDGGRPDVANDGQLDGGDAAEVSSPPVDAVADTTGGGGNRDTAVIGDAGPFAVCKSATTMTGVSAADFCTHVMMNCGFGSGPGKFTDIGSCLIRYNNYDAQQKACSAYHACVAGTSAQNAILHCPHPAGAPSNNPCDLPL